MPFPNARCKQSLMSPWLLKCPAPYREPHRFAQWGSLDNRGNLKGAARRVCLAAPHENLLLYYSAAPQFVQAAPVMTT